MRPYLLAGIAVIAGLQFPVSIWSLFGATSAVILYNGIYALIMIALVVLSSMGAYKLNHSLIIKSDKTSKFLKKV